MKRFVDVASGVVIAAMVSAWLALVIAGTVWVVSHL